MFILNLIKCSPEILATIKRRSASALTVDLEHTDLHQPVSRKWSHHWTGPEVGVIITWHRFQRAVWVLWWLPWLQWIKRYHCVRKVGSGRCLLQEQLLSLSLTLCADETLQTLTVVSIGLKPWHHCAFSSRLGRHQHATSTWECQCKQEVFGEELLIHWVNTAVYQRSAKSKNMEHLHLRRFASK